MHPFEKWWQESYISFMKKIKNDSRKIYLDLTGNINKDREILALAFKKFIGEKAKEFSVEELLTHYNTFLIIMLYKKYHKNIYDIDEKLEKLMLEATFNENIPSLYFTYPKVPFFAIALERNRNNPYFFTFYEVDNIKYMNIARANVHLVTLVLKENETFKECLIKNGVILNKEDPNYSRVTSLFNILLYILGDKDIIAEVHPGINPKKRFLNHSQPIYGKTPTVYKVGTKYRKLIERYELDGITDSYKSNGESERTVRPHVRSAHFHSYWTGPGRTILTVKLLMSCLVNGHLMNFTDLSEDITDVK
jgi:hypothetical protein